MVQLAILLLALCNFTVKATPGVQHELKVKEELPFLSESLSKEMKNIQGQLFLSGPFGHVHLSDMAKTRTSYLALAYVRLKNHKVAQRCCPEGSNIMERKSINWG